MHTQLNAGQATRALRMDCSVVFRRCALSVALIASLGGAPPGFSQQSIAPYKRVETSTPANPPAATTPSPEISPVAAPAPAGVRIGTGDLLEINVYTVYGAPDVTQRIRVSSKGMINMPFVGDVHVGGLNAEEAEAAIAKSFRDGEYMNNPHVTVLISEYATQGISVMGEVNKPGVYPVVAPRRLMDLLSQAGGLTSRAGKTVVVTHRNTPSDPRSVNLADKDHPGQANIDIQPGDTIVVPAAGVVYVIGNVQKPGGFTMDSNENMTVMQAIALAEGVKPLSSLDRSRLIRKTSNGTQEIPLPLSKILSAKAPDVTLAAGDVVFVPNSAGKGVARRTAEALLQAATGSVIYRPPW
jgi:polysaccharide biosynthesis/export protein